MNCNNRIELLSPAGNPDCFYAAVAAGADAVYAGLSAFSARAYAGNFSMEEFLKAMDYAHLFGRKLYLTLNTLVKEREFSLITPLLDPLYQNGLDGVIVQDMGVISFLRENYPLLPLHASTQMALTGVSGARLLKEMGACRIVTARELSIGELEEICRDSGVEVECFIHGAMCYSYSGLCLMSSMLGGRSGNRGRCAGSCRQPYSCVEEDDLNSGRRRDPIYPSSIEDSYKGRNRGRSDSSEEEGSWRGRKRGRSYSSGEEDPWRGQKRNQFYSSGEENQKWGQFNSSGEEDPWRGQKRGRSDSSGTEGVRKSRKRGQSHSPGAEGSSMDGEEYLLSMRDLCGIERIPELIRIGVSSLKIEGRMKSPAYVAGVTEIYRKYIDLYYERGEFSVDPTDMEALISLYSRGGSPDGYFRRRNGRDMITLTPGGYKRALPEDFSVKRLHMPLDGEARIEAGQPMRLYVKDTSGANCFTALGQVADRAEKRAVSQADVRKQLLKTGDSFFSFKSLSIDLGGEVFVPVSTLNSLRREALEGLKNSILLPFKRNLPDKYEDKANEDGASSSVWAKVGQGGGEASCLPGFILQFEDQARAEEVCRLLAESRNGFAGISAICCPERPSLLSKYDDSDREGMGAAGEGEIAWIQLLPHILRSQSAPLSGGGMTDSGRKGGRDTAPQKVNAETIDGMTDSGRKEEQNTGRSESSPCQETYGEGPRLFDFSAEGILVRNYEELFLLKESPYAGRIIADAALYTWNSRACREIRRFGISEDTVPYELNEKEIRQRGIGNSSIILYGRAPLMISAQCIHKTRTGKCGRRLPEGRRGELTDRKKAVFPVQMDCRNCYNVIYNSLPQSLHRDFDKIQALEPASMRLCFTVEEAGECLDIIKYYVNLYFRQRPAGPGQRQTGRPEGHTSGERHAAPGDKALQNKSREDQHFQDEALQDEALQDKAPQDKALQDKTLQTRSLQDKALQGKSLKGGSLQAKAALQEWPSSRPYTRGHFGRGAE
ncbi:MAG: U32 family peptidase [Lachnospiraceae bacterium]|nr:U32 family peptidase [Lachnospiraceae bacterium]